MKITETKLKGCFIVSPKIFRDERGLFFESFQKAKLEKAIGHSLNFVQDNRSRSVKNVLRGLHFQKTKPQGKLVSVTEGEVYDVVAVGGGFAGLSTAFTMFSEFKGKKNCLVLDNHPIFGGEAKQNESGKIAADMTEVLQKQRFKLVDPGLFMILLKGLHLFE